MFLPLILFSFMGQPYCTVFVAQCSTLVDSADLPSARRYASAHVCTAFFENGVRLRAAKQWNSFGKYCSKSTDANRVASGNQFFLPFGLFGMTKRSKM